MGKLERVAGAVTSTGVFLAGMFILDPGTGKLAQVKLGPFAIWDRRRWEARPMVRQWRAKRGGVDPAAPTCPAPAPSGRSEARSSDPGPKVE